MRRFAAATFIVFAILGLSPNVHAVPTFTWEGQPWNVTLLPNSFDEGERAFGASATQDGQILDTIADTAVAKSEVGGGGSTNCCSTGVNFSRQFVLSDAPLGWTVSIHGALNGEVSALGSVGVGGNATASITPSIGIGLNAGLGPQIGGPPPTILAVNQSKEQTGVLSDGLYTVSGQLVTSAGRIPGTSGGFADANFFAPSGHPGTFGFEVSVTATPLPEPSAILLFATGLAGFVWAYRRQDRHRNVAELS